MTILQDLIEQDFGIKGYGRWMKSVEHSSLVYDAEKDVFFWNSRELSGNALDYLTKVRGISVKAARETLRNIYLPTRDIKEYAERFVNPYSKLVDVFWANGINNRDYWYNRCIRDETIDRRRLGYFEGWSLIPLDNDGKFVNFQMRRDVPEKVIKLWYKIPGWKPVLVNSEVLQLVDTVYITEGPVDAILLSQEGIPAVSHTGGAVYWGADWFSSFNKVNKIYYIMDNDEVGRKAGEKVAKALGVYRTYLYCFEDKKKGYDTGDFFKEGGTAEEFKDIMESNAKSIFELGGTDVRRYEGKSYRSSTAANRRY